MTPAPTFKKATDPPTDSTNVNFGAPDINYLTNVLDGTDALDRIQLKNLERFATPWTYFVYQEGGVTYAMRASDGHREFEDSNNPRNPIQLAMDQGQALYDKAVIYLAPQTFTFPMVQGAEPVTTGSNACLISIGGHEGRTPKSNMSIIGAGMDKTILQNAAITKNSSGNNTFNNIFANFTIDAGAIATPQTSEDVPDPEGITGFDTAMHFLSHSHNFKVLRVKARNAKGHVFRWSGVDRTLIEDCYFIDGGLGLRGEGQTTFKGADNCPGGQLYFTDTSETVPCYNETVWRNCYNIKTTASRGGGMYTTGRSGFVLMENCHAINAGSQSYSGFSFENDEDYGPHRGVKLINCRGWGPRMGCQIGNNAPPEPGTWESDHGIIMGCIFTGVIRAKMCQNLLVSDCIVHDSTQGGIEAVWCGRVKLQNCLVRNTNIKGDGGVSGGTGSGPVHAEGGVYIQNTAHSEISNVTVYDTRDTRVDTPIDNLVSGVLSTPYGLSASGDSLDANRTIIIDNCNFMGDVHASAAAPFWHVDSANNPDTTGMAIRVRNHGDVKIRGGRIQGPATQSDRIRIVTCNNVAISNVKNYNPLGIASMTTPASGATYTNNDMVPEVINIYGGTVSNVSKDGTQISNTSNVQVWLDPGETIAVTYSSAPTMVKDRR